MKKLMFTCLIMLGFSLFLSAVTQTGRLLVVVHHQDDLLPGATVFLHSKVMMENRTLQTGPDGETIFRNLAPGMYTVDVIMDSFKPARGNARVQTLKTAMVIIELEPGEATEST